VAEAPLIISRLKPPFRSFTTFAECPAPKFAPEKTELRYHTPSQFGQLCTNCVKIAAGARKTPRTLA
jgi:hypothetical protein